MKSQMQTKYTCYYAEFWRFHPSTNKSNNISMLDFPERKQKNLKNEKREEREKKSPGNN